MRKILLIGLAIVLFTACEQKDSRYTQQSPEIDLVKKHIDNYNKKNYNMNGSALADSSKSFFNAKENPILRKDIIAYHEANDANYSKRGFLEKDQEFEMVVTDDGETWVNAWLDWQATLATNGKAIDMPVHMTFKIIDGKIVQEHGYWDPTEILMELQNIEAEKAMSVDEKLLKKGIDDIVKAWNANDQAAMKAAMTDNFIRTENGNVIVNSSSEYATNLMDVFFTGFPDFQVALDDYQIMGNKVLINWTVTGTNTGEFQGVTTNKPITTHGASIWTFEKDGKASREDAYYDNLTLFQQLGYSMPAPPKS
ncbi:ester cyclase [Gillisia sp. Q332]|uniref:ester cyclase n=1 Tax=Gillisia xinjiangensis TaxID=3384765 RepID=UPI00391CB2EF